MTESKPARPGPVTVAGVLVMSGSLFVLLSAFEQVSGLHSLATRESVEDFLSRSPGDQLDVSVATMLEVLRWTSMATAACAVAAGILGFHVLRRSKSARWGLTVVAVPLFFTGVVAGGFMSSVVAAATVMLWLQPARDWFNGVSRPRRDPTTPAADQVGTPWTGKQWAEKPADRPGFGGSDPTPPPQSGASSDTSAGPLTPSGAPPSTEPRPFTGFGETASQQIAGDRPTTSSPAGSSRRPPAVLWAALLTWIFSGLGLIMVAMSVGVLASRPELVFDELYRQNPELRNGEISEQTLTSVTYLLSAVLALWCVVAIVTAIFVLRGASWAQTTLIASASVAGLGCLLGAIASIALVVPAVACMATVVFLLGAEVRAWYRAHGTIGA